MILPDFEIKRYAMDDKTPLIRNFKPERVNPASYDMGLGGHIIDLNTGTQYELQEGETFILKPSHPILATTQEYFCLPNWLCATVYLKSSAARRGLDHALAGFVDPAFYGELTLEFHAHTEQRLVIGKCYTQIKFERMMMPPQRDYTVTGRYNGQRGATKAID